MQKIVCNKHRLELIIPTTEDEFLLGKMHDKIMIIQSHHEQFPNCKFCEVSNE